jgi:hypothetical protein
MVISIDKLAVLSEIARDIGQVFFASTFVGPLAVGAINWPVLISGLVASLLFWAMSILLSKG